MFECRVRRNTHVYQVFFLYIYIKCTAEVKATDRFFCIIVNVGQNGGKDRKRLSYSLDLTGGLSSSTSTRLVST